MSAAMGNFLGLTQKSLLETIWRMATSSPTIFAGDPAWILGCRYRTCSHLRPVTSMHVRALVNDVTDRVLISFSLDKCSLGPRHRMTLVKHQPKRNDNRADKCCGHVLLGVPNVALRAEIGGAEIGPNNLGNDRFQYFEKTA